MSGLGFVSQTGPDGRLRGGPDVLLLSARVEFGDDGLSGAAVSGDCLGVAEGCEITGSGADNQRSRIEFLGQAHLFEAFFLSSHRRQEQRIPVVSGSTVCVELNGAGKDRDIQMHYLLFYEVGQDYVSKRAEFRNAHLEKAWKASDRGELLLGGALANPVDGAVLLFQGESPEVAEKFAKADPYVTSGAVKRWYVREWTTVAGKEAATPVRRNLAPAARSNS